MKTLQISASVLKIILGAFFIISAVSKFITIDIFEMYVYSFGLFELGLSMYVSRLVIAIELILGAAMISNRHHRFSCLMTLLFLTAFVVFLSYAHISGRSDSCHCMGEMTAMTPIQSLLKNAILIMVLVFVYKYAPREWAPRWPLVIAVYLAVIGVITVYMYYALHILDLYAYVLLFVMLCVGLLASFSFYNKWYVAVSLILSPVVSTFIISPPDSWLFGDMEERFDEDLFMSQIRMAPQEVGDTVSSDSTMVYGTLSQLGLEEGRHVVAFFSPRCGYCRLAAGKLSTIVARNRLDASLIDYVFPIVKDTTAYVEFYEEALSQHFRESRIDKNVFIKVTRASFPLILLMEDGVIAKSYSYRNIDEGVLKDFLRGS